MSGLKRLGGGGRPPTSPVQFGQLPRGVRLKFGVPPPQKFGGFGQTAPHTPANQSRRNSQVATPRHNFVKMPILHEIFFLAPAAPEIQIFFGAFGAKKFFLRRANIENKSQVQLLGGQL